MSLGLSIRSIQQESYFINNRILIKFLSKSLHSHSQLVQPCPHCSGANLRSDYGHSPVQNNTNKPQHPLAVAHNSQNFYRRELKHPAIAVCSYVSILYVCSYVSFFTPLVMFFGFIQL